MKFYEKKDSSLILNTPKIEAKEEQNVVSKDKNISFKTLLYVYIAIALGCFLLLPMIYIKNHIYYLSRDISVLLNEHAVLLEENMDLQRKIEQIRFKNQVLDTLEIK